MYDHAKYFVCQPCKWAEGDIGTAGAYLCPRDREDLWQSHKLMCASHKDAVVDTAQQPKRSCTCLSYTDSQGYEHHTDTCDTYPGEVFK